MAEYQKHTVQLYEDMYTQGEFPLYKERAYKQVNLTVAMARVKILRLVRRVSPGENTF